MDSKPVAKNSKLLEQQYRKYEQEIRRFLAKQVANDEIAEDLTQEAFLKVQNVEDLQSINNPRAYLFAITRNLLIDHFKNRKTQQQDDMLEFDENIHWSKTSTEENRLEAREDLRRLAVAIRSLPPRAQKAFILNRVYRFSYAEVGRMMGISPRTVENHAIKGLNICIRELGRLDDDDKKTDKSNSVINFSAIRSNKKN